MPRPTHYRVLAVSPSRTGTKRATQRWKQKRQLCEYDRLNGLDILDYHPRKQHA